MRVSPFFICGRGRQAKSAIIVALELAPWTANTWISDIRARQRAGRNIIVIRLNRLGWSREKIAEIVGLGQNRISEIIGNTILGEIDNLLSQGRDMNYIAGHYSMDRTQPGGSQEIVANFSIPPGWRLPCNRIYRNWT